MITACLEEERFTTFVNINRTNSFLLRPLSATTLVKSDFNTNNNNSTAVMHLNTVMVNLTETLANLQRRRPHLYRVRLKYVEKPDGNGFVRSVRPAFDTPKSLRRRPPIMFASVCVRAFGFS